MGTDEFTEWQLEYARSPWGEWRADLRNGLLAAVVVNSRQGRSGKTYAPADFMPDFEGGHSQSAPPIAKRQTAEEIRALMGLWLEA